jgi:hypothetical protein
MSEHEHERTGPERIPYRGFPHGFPSPQHHEYEFGYRGYRLPPTREEELEILEKWKTKMDKKLARIEQRIEELKKEA